MKWRVNNEHNVVFVAFDTRNFFKIERSCDIVFINVKALRYFL